MSSKKDYKAHAKGVVLGLTMAEIALLIIFILLLIFTSMLKKEQKLNEVIKKHEEAIGIISKFIVKEDNTINDELVKASEKLPQLLKKVEEKDLKKTTEEILPEILERAIDKLVLAKDLEKNNDDLSIEKKYEKLLEEKQELNSKLSNLEGQNKNLLKQCKGIGFPPCWANLSGSPEYIFNLYLRDDGILIHDNKLPHRQTDQEKLNLTRISFEKPLSPAQTIYQTQPLLEYGKQNECRFFVQIIDETGADKKELYKNLRQAVEANFYILKRN
jgi:hypothetical protein